jgi:crystallin alpha B
MSLMFWHPAMRGEDWFSFPTPSRIFDQSFGSGLFESDPMFRDAMMMMNHPTGNVLPYWMRPHRVPRVSGDEAGMSEVISDKDKFQINIDVSHFKPDELTVKTTDNFLCITGKHDEKMDEHGYIKREFTRRYMLPKEVDPKAIVSSLSQEGILTVQAPKVAIENTNERNVPIEMGKKPALENK